MDTSSFWALVGVTLGFALGEGSRLVRHWLRIGRLKKLIRDELVSIRTQIPQKRGIVQRMVAALGKQRLLSGISVAIVNTGYRQHISELYEHLSVHQRNCLHVIHERLRVADDVLNTFVDDFQAAKRDKVIKDPFDAFRSTLNDMDTSYQLVDSLIGSYLDNNPVDVFGVDAKLKKK